MDGRLEAYLKHVKLELIMHKMDYKSRKLSNSYNKEPINFYANSHPAGIPSNRYNQEVQWQEQGKENA